MRNCFRRSNLYARHYLCITNLTISGVKALSVANLHSYEIYNDNVWIKFWLVNTQIKFEKATQANNSFKTQKFLLKGLALFLFNSVTQLYVL